ncbi:O-antigen polysaccharide polymerase Wzy [Modicisalibacter muralis]|uniref:O-antigen polysaccharide polymerase Wzy n=1 Tax=Modicisalibacter muralis TaxID=119000 RepID=UPI001113D76B|nr:O-antigen polysaccharide polymerase Wzy [Halomonas muralis]
MIYFLRILSNYHYIDSDAEIFKGGLLQYFSTFMSRIVGSGNVADLQQLVIIFKTWGWGDFAWDVTYFDWLINTFGGFVGLEPSSIGLTIRDTYFPGKSGAPTPGAIGEAYYNFSIFAPLFMLLIGSMFSYLYQKVKASGSNLLLMIYSIFLLRFVFLFSKVDSTMMSNFFWGAVPFLLTMCFIFFVLSLFDDKKYSGAV